MKATPKGIEYIFKRVRYLDAEMYSEADILLAVEEHQDEDMRLAGMDLRSIRGEAISYLFDKREPFPVSEKQLQYVFEEYIVGAPVEFITSYREEIPVAYWRDLPPEDRWIIVREDPSADSVVNGLEEAIDSVMITEFEMEDIGLDHAQFFGGRSAMHGPYDHVQVGIGITQMEAFDGALRALSADGWKVSLIEQEYEEQMNTNIDPELSAYMNQHPEQPIELYYHIAIYYDEPMGAE